MTVRRASKLTAFFLFTMSFGAQAQTKPNLSGTWKMDPAKSTFGGGPAPKSRLDRISHNEPNLKDTITQDLRGRESTYDMNYSTDGSETSNSVNGTAVKSAAKWEGDELVIDTKGSIMGRSLKFHDRWSLSPDGKTLTLVRHLSNPMGESDQTIVFDKQ